MTTLSSRLALAELQAAADLVTNYPPTQSNNMGILDNALLYASGVLSSRPSGSVSGITYSATDNGFLYGFSNGTWYTLPVAGSWQPLSLGTNVGSVAGHYAPQGRVEGDQVRLRGWVSSSQNASVGQVWTTVPAGLRPTTLPASVTTLGFNMSTSTGSLSIGGILNISTGNITHQGASLTAGTNVYLDGILYSLVQ